MQFNDEATINDVVLYVENSKSELINIIIAFNNENILIAGSSQFELENDSFKKFVIGKEWTIKSQILDIVKWIFIQSFTNDEIETSFLYFSRLLQIIQSKQISKENFGMLGEILFAYHMQLEAIEIKYWLTTKNSSFDFNISNHYYEIKTKSIIDTEVLINLSYNQVTSLSNTNVSLVLVDMNSSQYSIQRKTLINHFQNLQIDQDATNKILECLEVFNYFEHFNFNVLKYIGPKIHISLDEKIIGLDCKVKFDAQYDFSNFIA
jgi:hypothetical protein